MAKWGGGYRGRRIPYDELASDLLAVAFDDTMAEGQGWIPREPHSRITLVCSIAATYLGIPREALAAAVGLGFEMAHHASWPVEPVDTD